MGGRGTDPSEQGQAGEGLARGQPSPPHGGLTLGTMCSCGHIRKDHSGLRMEVKGHCLACDCEEFTRVPASVPDSPEQMMEQIRARLDQLERLRESVASLCAQLGDGKLNGSYDPNR